MYTPAPEWVSSSACSASGLARLPAVFVAPAQALLLAALAPSGEGSGSGEGEGEGAHLPR